MPRGRDDRGRKVSRGGKNPAKLDATLMRRAAAGEVVVTTRIEVQPRRGGGTREDLDAPDVCDPHARAGGVAVDILLVEEFIRD